MSLLPLFINNEEEFPRRLYWSTGQFTPKGQMFGTISPKVFGGVTVGGAIASNLKANEGPQNLERRFRAKSWTGVRLAGYVRYYGICRKKG